MGNANLLHFLAIVVAGWVNRHQQAIIEYLMEENRIFKHQLQGRRLHLSDSDRRRLAAKANRSVAVLRMRNRTSMSPFRLALGDRFFMPRPSCGRSDPPLRGAPQRPQ